MKQLKYTNLNVKTRFIPLVFIILLATSYFVLVYATGSSVNGLLGVMFLFYLPVTLGALVAYAIQLITHSRKNTYLILFCTLLLSFLVCAVFMGEGIICIIIVSPILYIMMIVGAEITHFICKFFWKPNGMFSLAVVPFIMIFFPASETIYDNEQTHHIIINASTEQVWRSINNISDIKPSELSGSWAAKIGVPTPLSATTVVTDSTPTGLVRKCQWHKNIWFDEPITEFIPNKKLGWYFKFYPNSVPKGALDDHVTINGEHFKLLNASYDLQKINDEQTKLTFNVRYQVITNMNWYTSWWADFFINDFSENVLKLYKDRLEQTI